MTDVQASFAALARSVADDHPEVADYKALSDYMLKEIEGQERQLLSKLLPGYMRAVLSRRVAAESDEEAWDSFLEERLPSVSGETVFVRDASADDLAAAVVRRQAFAGSLDKRAKQFARVEKKMRATGAVTVEQLGPAIGAITIAELEIRTAAVRSQNLKARQRVMLLEGLRVTRDQLRAAVEQRESPSLVVLRSMREWLLTLIGEERYRQTELRIIDEVFEEMYGTGKA